MIPWLEPGDPFPPVETALREPNGLLAASRRLSARQLLDAYPRGIFPWSAEDQPVLWWSPDPRMVLFTEEFRWHRSLRRRLSTAQRAGIEVSVDRAFDAVMRECAAPRAGQSGTWITLDMLECYGELHRAGLAHSVEVWHERELLGGLYGVALGRMYFGESMFTRSTDASKLALGMLVALLNREQVPVIDCQQHTAHLAFLGARDVRRAEFCAHVDEATRLAPVHWNRYRGVNLLDYFGA